jgi:hypothetical protein
MYNWSTDVLKIDTKEKKAIWKLEQMVNFGLGGSKIKRELLKKYWGKLNLDSDRKKLFEFFLWKKKKY